MKKPQDKKHCKIYPEKMCLGVVTKKLKYHYNSWSVEGCSRKTLDQKAMNTNF